MNAPMRASRSWSGPIVSGSYPARSIACGRLASVGVRQCVRLLGGEDAGT